MSQNITQNTFFVKEKSKHEYINTVKLFESAFCHDIGWVKNSRPLKLSKLVFSTNLIDIEGVIKIKIKKVSK